MSGRRRDRRTPARRIPSAFAVARRCLRVFLDWDPIADPVMRDVRAALENELAGLSPTDLVRVCGQSLVLARSLALELPIERRAMVLAELDQLQGLADV